MQVAAQSVDSDVYELISQYFPGAIPIVGTVADPEASNTFSFVVIPVSKTTTNAETHLEGLRKALVVRGLSGITVDLDYT
jgi:hypothetical protein